MLIKVKPIVEFTDQFGILVLIGGVPVEDFSENWNADSVDTEASFELPKIATVVGAVDMHGVEGGVDGVFIQFVETVNRERGSVSAKDVAVAVFGIDCWSSTVQEWFASRLNMAASARHRLSTVRVGGLETSIQNNRRPLRPVLGSAS